MTYTPLRFFLVLVLPLLWDACSKEEVIPAAEEREDTHLLSQDYVIAHRGFWNKKDAPQNSRAAFERALELRIYGVEFDVRQTIDGELVICHDADFGGMIIEKSTYNELCASRLANGETIPLLEDFLSIRRKADTQVKLIIDIKKCSIVDLVHLIEEYDLQDAVIYITFTKGYCHQLAELDYGANTYYSNNGTTTEDIKEYGFGGVCYRYTFLDENSELVVDASSLGIGIMVWTVNNPKKVHDYSVEKIYVITDAPEEF